MKKALLIAAAAASLCGPTFVASVPASATEIVAQAMQADTGMKTAIDKLHDQMSAMTPSGDTDKDYKTFMRMLGTAMKSATEAEMKNGKDASTKASAKSTYEKLFGSNQNPFYMGG